MSEGEKAIQTIYYLGQLAAFCTADGVKTAITYPEEYQGAPAWRVSVEDGLGAEDFFLGASVHEAIEGLYKKIHEPSKPLEMTSTKEGIYEMPKSDA